MLTDIISILSLENYVNSYQDIDFCSLYIPVRRVDKEEKM